MTSTNEYDQTDERVEKAKRRLELIQSTLLPEARQRSADSIARGADRPTIATHGQQVEALQVEAEELAEAVRVLEGPGVSEEFLARKQRQFAQEREHGVNPLRRGQS